MNIITGYTGEPHITSAQDRDGNQGAYGTGSYILNVGAKMAASIVSVNEIRIGDGALCHQGCLGNIDKGMYESVSIANGTQGMKRNDLIVCRYTKENGTNVEDLSLVVIQGSPTSGTPVDPAYNTGDIQSGDTPVDMPLYRVNINGVNISSVTRLAPYVSTQAEIDEQIATMNDKYAVRVAVSLSITQTTLAAGASAYQTVTLPTLSGYTLATFNVHNITGSNNGGVQATLTANGTLRLFNGSTSSATITGASADALFVKS